MTEQLPDLSNLLNSEANTEVKDEAEDAAMILMHSIKESFDERDQRLAAADLELRMLKSRVSTLETFVSYLLEQDPKMQERVKAMAEATEGKAAVDGQE